MTGLEAVTLAEKLFDQGLKAVYEALVTGFSLCKPPLVCFEDRHTRIKCVL